MTISEAKIKQLENKFDEAFDDNNGLELGKRFRTDDEATAEEIIDQALKSESFPMDANIYNVTADILIHKGRSTEDWAEHYINDKDISDEESFQTALNDDVYYFISENLEKTQIEVDIRDNLAVWLDKHGTVEYLESKMENEYEVIIIQEMIELQEPIEVQQKVKQALSEEGFPENVTADDVDYSVYDIKLTESFESLAERHIDDIEKHGGVDKYIKEQFYKDIINENLYTFSVDIESDREDFE
ncbi:hypothetical protein [Staphylococcus equorum]|uniref:Uncharacterized protein n=1 Tax=Staphylococcus equorum TaxID=246432 RepID=A0AAP7IG05_9STAP|nr:hypothetical protein [Staphylococcus equorum]OEK58871.1 hypothetical protein ASS94_00690 [Staphylococcus equorum]